MSAALHGLTGTISLGGELTGCRNWSISHVFDIHDATSMSSSGIRERKVGIEDYNGTAELNEYPGKLSGTTVAMSLVAAAGTYSGSAMVTDVTTNTPHDDLVTWNVSFECNNLTLTAPA